MEVKILVVANVEGDFDTVFRRVSTVHKQNGPFHVLFCVGDFFGPSEQETQQKLQPYLQGDKEIPIPTYFTCPLEQLPSSLDFSSCKNLHHLGSFGKETILGLTVMFLSNSDEAKKALPTLEEQGVDILLTGEWPKGFWLHLGESHTASLGDLPTLQSIGSEDIARLVYKVNPRYHFLPASTTGVYYERIPYVNSREYATRLIAIAKSSNDKKQKWLYAAKVTPISQMDPETLKVIPSGATFDPFDPNPPVFDEPPVDIPPQVLPFEGDSTNKRKVPSDGLLPLPPGAKRIDRNEHAVGYGGFFFDDSNQGGGRGGRGGRGGDGRGGRGGRGNGRGGDGRHQHQQQRQQQPQQPCWFCLGSETVERHLVVSVADSMYLALPKGGIVDDHILIIPIRHQTSIMVGLEPSEKRELNSYKEALTRFFSSFSTSSMTPVFFERNVVSPHGHIQVVPVPSSRAKDVISFFIEEGSKLGIEFQELPPLLHSSKSKEKKEKEDAEEEAEQGGGSSEDEEVGKVTQGRPYFYVEVEGRRLIHLVPPRGGGGGGGGGGHPMQFGRQVMAKFLGMEERTDWKKCALSKEEETNLATNFKTRFAAFDFSLAL